MGPLNRAMVLFWGSVAALKIGCRQVGEGFGLNGEIGTDIADLFALGDRFRAAAIAGIEPEFGEDAGKTAAVTGVRGFPTKHVAGTVEHRIINRRPFPPQPTVV